MGRAAWGAAGGRPLSGLLIACVTGTDESELPCAQLFSPRQQAQLDVYGVWGVLRGQLLTDDSFVFNRVLTRLKTSVANLAPVEEADEASLAAAQASSKALILGSEQV